MFVAVVASVGGWHSRCLLAGAVKRTCQAFLSVIKSSCPVALLVFAPPSVNCGLSNGMPRPGGRPWLLVLPCTVALLLAAAHTNAESGFIGPDSIFGEYDQSSGPSVRFCWAQHLPGKTMRVLPAPADDNTLNTTAVALRHMLQLGMDDLQSCTYDCFRSCSALCGSGTWSVASTWSQRRNTPSERDTERHSPPKLRAIPLKSRIYHHLVML